MDITSNTGHFSPVDISTIDASGSAGFKPSSLVLMARYELLHEKTTEQAQLIAGLNEQLRSLEPQKAMLIEQNLSPDEQQRRISALDSQAAELVARVSTEMIRLQDMTQVMLQALDVATKAIKNDAAVSGGAIRNLT